MKFFFILMLSFPAFSQEAPARREVPPPPRPILTPAPVAPGPRSVRPQDLRPSDQQRLREAIRERSGGAGGDDVGNGGDELRIAFVSLAQQWARVFPQLTDYVGIDHLIVTQGLVVNGSSATYAVVQGKILLDSQRWDPITGLLAAGQDARLVVGKLLIELANLSISEEEILRAWHSFDARSAQIVCLIDTTSQKTERSVRTFSAEGQSSTDAETRVMNACHAAGLSECRLTDSSMRGFGRSIVAQASARGWSEHVREKSQDDIQSGACHALRACESAYDWAPQGQVKAADFTRVNTEANRVCGSRR